MDCSASEKTKSEAGFGGEKKPRILVAACGCVEAAEKFGVICNCFIEWAEVRAVVTNPSLRLIDRSSFPRDVFVYCDEHERHSKQIRIDRRVLHVELLQWADIMVIAPLSAHTLAMIAGGFSDNLLTFIVRAWDYKKKPMFVAPSMDPLVWKNRLTERHCKKCVELGISLIQPVSQSSGGEGEYKIGAMAEPSHISRTVKISYSKFQKKNVGGV